LECYSIIVESSQNDDSDSKDGSGYKDHNSSETPWKWSARLGVSFLFVVLVLAVIFPHPSPFQYLVFRVVLTVAAGGVAVVLIGVKDFRVRALGVLAVLLMVYAFDPSSRIVGIGKEPTDFMIILTCNTSEGVRVNPIRESYADMLSEGNYQKFTDFISHLRSQDCDQRGSAILRSRDRMIVGAHSTATLTSGGNSGVIVIPPAVAHALNGTDNAFVLIRSFARKNNNQNGILPVP